MTYPDQTRNLNPTAEARIAMIVWGDRYGAFGGGSMDFWDALTPLEKRRCELAVQAVREHDQKAND